MFTTRKSLRLGVPAVALAALAALALAFAPSAAASTEISINPGNVPTTADDFTHSCDQIPGGASLPGQDGWVFVLPGKDGKFVTVTAVFEDADGNEHSLNATVLDGPGTSKAYVITPIGWTLVDASATITGSAPQDQFNLTHACPGTEGGGPSPSTSPTTSPSASPTTSPTGSPTTTPTTTPTGSESPTTPTSPPPTTTVPAPTTTSPGGLPVTGAGLTGILAAGVALAAAGAGTLLLVRRRRAAAGGDLD